MRRPKHVALLVATGLLVLVGAASATRSHPYTNDVSAAFSANQTRMHTRTCTEGGNTFRVTNAVWRGTSTSSDPRLDGTLTINTHAIVNETTGDGWLSGTWRTRAAQTARPRSNAKSFARLNAVIDNGNHVDGLANGDARRPYGRLLGNWSATIVGSTMTGELGANTPVAPDNSALIFRGGCP
jgi:hypothetical protein